MKHPRKYSTTDYESLFTIVKREEYRLYNDQNDVPPALKQEGGFSSSENYRATMIMAASTSRYPPAIGNIKPALNSPIYKVARIRFDKHPDGRPHFNKDEVLIFADARGETWRMNAMDSTGHYIPLVKNSGLDVAINAFKLPSKPYGNLSELKDSKMVDFSTGD